MCRLMFIYWKYFAEASLSFTVPRKKNDNQSKNSQDKQIHLLAIIESHRWGFPRVTKYIFTIYMTRGKSKNQN